MLLRAGRSSDTRHRDHGEKIVMPLHPPPAAMMSLPAFFQNGQVSVLFKACRDFPVSLYVSILSAR